MILITTTLVFGSRPFPDIGEKCKSIRLDFESKIQLQEENQWNMGIVYHCCLFSSLAAPLSSFGYTYTIKLRSV